MDPSKQPTNQLGLYHMLVHFTNKFFYGTFTKALNEFWTYDLTVNTKFPNCKKSNNWKEVWFANINLYWWIMSTIFISILLQKNTLWFYLLWTWLEQEIFLTLVGRWIERSSQQISSFELIRDLLFFKSLNMKAFRLKFFGT